ncbi:MAG TPA: hypothetical protein P5572_02125 [Phycisphaerae bacterium]|nr:hypothetical protein [Phycisphaerales bacterium]HRX83798.1 hypothetical protein [Phycisphaerae bacterium]
MNSAMPLRRIVAGTVAICGCGAALSCAQAQVPPPPGPPQVATAGVDEQIAVIERLANHERAKWTDVHTWRGRLEVTDVECYFGARREQLLANLGRDAAQFPAEFKKILRGTVDFRLDRDSAALFTRFATEAVGVVGLEDGADTGIHPAPFEQLAIVTPGEYLHFEPGVAYAQPGGTRARVAFREPAAEARRQQMGTLVDPRGLMGYGRPTWENLQLIADALRAAGALRVGDAELTVWTDAAETIIIMPGQAGQDRLVFQQMKFVGDNLTDLSMYDAAGRVYQHVTWTYPAGGGADRATAMEFQTMSADGTRIAFQRTLRLVDSALNAPVGDTTFTRANLGLTEDDLYVDRIAGTLSRLRDGGLIALPAEQATAWLAAE